MYQQIVKYMGVKTEPQHNYDELDRSPFLYSDHYIRVLLNNAIKRKNAKQVQQVYRYLERYGKNIREIDVYQELVMKSSNWISKHA